MSQSDYIRRKTVANQLKELSKLGSVLDSQKYTDFKGFSLENNIVSSSHKYNQTVPSNIKRVFNINLQIQSACPQFALCTGTNARPNRLLRSLKMPSPRDLPPIQIPILKLIYCRKQLCKIQEDS
jgi:hypothetical protein